MNVLVITSHPDDMEELCGGTLIRCVQRGDHVTVCHVANGNMGHEVLQPEELRSIREQEAKNSGALAGIDILTCDIGDLLVQESSLEQRNMIVDVIRSVQPDFIITHAPNDYMSDHVAVSRLVFDAAFAASVPHYTTSDMEQSIAAVTPIYYMETCMGVNFIPSEYVDISDAMELKLQMLMCHESQIKWLLDHDGIDYTETVRTCARYRGLQCGTKYAEAFSQCQTWPRIVPRRLLP